MNTHYYCYLKWRKKFLKLKQWEILEDKKNMRNNLFFLTFFVPINSKCN